MSIVALVMTTTILAASRTEIVQPSGYREGIEKWFNASYLPLMKEKGTEVRSRVKAIVAAA